MATRDNPESATVVISPRESRVQQPGRTGVFEPIVPDRLRPYGPMHASCVGRPEAFVRAESSAMGEQTSTVRELSRGQCLALLSTAPVGRVGVSLGALPVILPVNYVVLDERVVFRTVPGTKLDAATARTVVAFEADGHDPHGTWGWSVLIQGVARELTEAGAGQGPSPATRRLGLPRRPSFAFRFGRDHVCHWQSLRLRPGRQVSDLALIPVNSCSSAGDAHRSASGRSECGSRSGDGLSTPASQEDEGRWGAGIGPHAGEDPPEGPPEGMAVIRRPSLPRQAARRAGKGPRRGRDPWTDRGASGNLAGNLCP